MPWLGLQGSLVTQVQLDRAAGDHDRAGATWAWIFLVGPAGEHPSHSPMTGVSDTNCRVPHGTVFRLEIADHECAGP